MEARKGQAPSKGTGTGEGTTGQLRVREQHVWLVPWGEVGHSGGGGPAGSPQGRPEQERSPGQDRARLCPVLSCDRGLGEGAWEAELASRLG